MFQRNAEMFLYFANLHPRLINFWKALRTGVPEIQAKALSLLHDDPNSIDLVNDPFEGNVLFTSSTNLTEIPWKPTLYKEVRDYILRTKVLVQEGSCPTSETEGSVIICTDSSSFSDSDFEDEDEDEEPKSKKKKSTTKEDPDLQTDEDYIYRTGTECGFFDIELPEMGHRGLTLNGKLLRVTHGDDTIDKIPGLDNEIDLAKPQHMTSCLISGYLYPILANAKTLLALPEKEFRGIYSMAVEYARGPVIFALTERSLTTPIGNKPIPRSKVAERLDKVIRDYDGKIDPSIIMRYKIALGMVQRISVKTGKPVPRRDSSIPPYFSIPGRLIRGFPPPFGSPIVYPPDFVPDTGASLSERVFHTDVQMSVEQEDATEILYSISVEKKNGETEIKVNSGVSKSIIVPDEQPVLEELVHSYARRAFQHLLNRDLILLLDRKLGGFLRADMKRYLLHRADEFQKRYIETLAKLKGGSP